MSNVSNVAQQQQLDAGEQARLWRTCAYVDAAAAAALIVVASVVFYGL